MNRIVHYSNGIDESLVSAINIIYNESIFAATKLRRNESDITIEISSYNTEEGTFLVAKNKHRSEVDVNFNSVITTSFVNESDEKLQEETLYNNINSIKCRVLLAIVPEKWYRVKFVYVGKCLHIPETVNEKGNYTTNYVVNIIKSNYKKCVEALSGLIEKMFSKTTEQSGITCPYDGGYYTFRYATQELLNNGEGYIMYKKDSETFVQLNGGVLYVYDFKSFNENWKFKWHSGTISELFIPKEADLKGSWVVKKKTPLNKYDSSESIGFATCGSIVDYGKIKREK